MSEEFAGKVALVTGGGNGIGAAASQALAHAGATVALLDRDHAAAEAVAAEIVGHGGKAGAHALDVADGAAFARLPTAIAEREGGIDVLVNCAGTITRHTIARCRPPTGTASGGQSARPVQRRSGGLARI